MLTPHYVFVCVRITEVEVNNYLLYLCVSIVIVFVIVHNYAWIVNPDRWIRAS